MINKNFTKLTKEQLKRCADTLCIKNVEYSPNVDRLHFFKKAAAMEQKTPEESLWYMLMKHLVSISEMIDSHETFPLALWDEKITDSMNYLILLRALIEDEYEQNRS